MKYFKTVLLLACSPLLLTGSTTDAAQAPENTCYVHLFDGKDYKDDNIVLKGPGEFVNLKSLPGTTKDWDDEADSFQSGKNTTVTFYSEPDFKGKAVTYKGGARKASMEEPRSMKITCNK